MPSVHVPMKESFIPYLRAKFFTEPQDRLYGGFGGIRYTNQQPEVPPTANYHCMLM